MSDFVDGEYADIYEGVEDIVNDILYYVKRDNFYGKNKSWLKHNFLSKEEVRNKFLKAPDISDKRVYEFAAANALYYLNDFGCESVDWVDKALNDCDEIDSEPFYYFVSDIENEKENTPEEFKKFGFIVHKKHFEVR